MLPVYIDQNVLAAVAARTTLIPHNSVRSGLFFSLIRIPFIRMFQPGLKFAM